MSDIDTIREALELAQRLDGMGQARFAARWSDAKAALDRLAARVGEWQPIKTAEQHIKDTASVMLMEAGRSRVRIYHGPDWSLYALWNGGDEGSPASLWCRLPDFPQRPLPPPPETTDDQR